MAGREEADFVFRDSLVCAFMDIQPVNPGHLLVVPIAHAPYLADLDTNVGAHMFRVGHRLANAIRCSGFGDRNVFWPMTKVPGKEPR